MAGRRSRPPRRPCELRGSIAWRGTVSPTAALLLLPVTSLLDPPPVCCTYRQASADRNRRKGGSQSISKCAREIGRTVSQFLNVYGQVSQFLKTKCTEIGPDAYKVGRRVPIYIAARVCSAPTHVAGQAPLSGAPSHNRMWRPYLLNSPERDVLHALESTLRTHAHSQPAHSVT